MNSQLPPADEDDDELFDGYFAQTQTTFSGYGRALEQDAPDTMPMHQDPSLFG